MSHIQLELCLVETVQTAEATTDMRVCVSTFQKKIECIYCRKTRCKILGVRFSSLQPPTLQSSGTASAAFLHFSVLYYIFARLTHHPRSTKLI